MSVTTHVAAWSPLRAVWSVAANPLTWAVLAYAAVVFVSLAALWFLDTSNGP